MTVRWSFMFLHQIAFDIFINLPSVWLRNRFFPHYETTTASLPNVSEQNSHTVFLKRQLSGYASFCTYWGPKITLTIEKCGDIFLPHLTQQYDVMRHFHKQNVPDQMQTQNNYLSNAGMLTVYKFLTVFKLWTVQI